MNRLFSSVLLFALAAFFISSCQMEPLEEHILEADVLEEFERGPFDVQPANLNDLQALGSKMNKRLGVDVIRSAQGRELSDFTFDLDASLVTFDSTQRKTYTVPFLEKENRYSTYNLVIVTDSATNLLDQYVLAYSFDSLQYRSFIESGDFLQSGTTIKRFSFSSFFNDSNPFSLERCQGITDENGNPVVCDQVTIDAGSGGGGGSSSGGTAWVTPGGATGSGNPSPSSGSSGSGGGTPCTWTVTSVREEVPNYGGSYCESSTSCITGYVVTISCGDAYSRKSASQNEGMMTCMDCDISDFGNPAFTSFLLESLDPDQKREAQLDYLNTHGASEFVSMIRQMMATPGLTMGDWAEINNLVNQIYLQQKGKFMMVIFSPENISQVLFLAFSTNISDALRNRVFSLTSRYSAYAEIASMLGNKSWTVGGLKITFNGYTSHGTIAYGISKGLSPSQIKTILGNGVPRIVTHARWGINCLWNFKGKQLLLI
ncbi:hypothetical protein [Algoriphagus sediminis]|uniref:Lipoprotein n=1 Tax=Algoriphagus sediminis TaxID=3057113 RepID=A0ABT7YBS5_9BACT|nr:hypothetical protein [Algoriphagus sediminis]MDN3203972.1 hypothetical protein [Algoriphagus sediminis]